MGSSQDQENLQILKKLEQSKIVTSTWTKKRKLYETSVAKALVHGTV